jgi:hypothetical protein
MRTIIRFISERGSWDRWAAKIASLAILVVLPLPMTAAEPTAKPPEQAAPAKKAVQAALDDALLNELDNELLEGAGNLKNRPQPKPAPDSPPNEEQPPAQPPIDGEDVGLPGHDNDPLVHISDEMRSAETLIPETSKREHAEQLQRQIIKELTQLVEQAERQQAQQQASSSKQGSAKKSAKRQGVKQPKPSAGNVAKNSNKPAQDSTDELRQSDSVAPDPELVKGLMKNSWGHLPPHAREQMLQSSPERFVPQYELMIEKYYKRLAEEQNLK